VLRGRAHKNDKPARGGWFVPPPAAVAVVRAVVSLRRRLQATSCARSGRRQRLIQPSLIRHDSFIAKLPAFASVAFPITARAYTGPFPAGKLKCALKFPTHPRRFSFTTRRRRRPLSLSARARYHGLSP